VQLPPPQGVSPEALATIPPARGELPVPEPSQTATKPPVTKKSAAPAAQVAPPPKPEAPAQAAETPPAQGPATPVLPPIEEPPRLTPVYTEEERRRIWAELDKRKTDIEGLLRGINQNRMSADQKSVVQRIHSFISVAEDSARRGDFRSAEALSERAVIFARELASGR
jgi:hypothetical protein